MSLPNAPPSVADAGIAAANDGLRRRVAELTEAVAARDAFMAVAAHELRNPMTPILGQVDLLLAAFRAGRCTPEQVEQRLGRIQHSVHRYLKRAEVLLGVSRLTRGGFQPDLQTFDLAALLREVVDEFAPAARHAGVSITLVAPDTLPVELDRMAMDQIIDNLLSNALKHGDRTPVEVTAGIVDGHMRIAVRDGGAGVPPNDRMRLLASFEGVAGQGERHGGFGIGLWLIARFVAVMQGTVVIGDAPGGGALFVVSLPLSLGPHNLGKGRE